MVNPPATAETSPWLKRAEKGLENEEITNTTAATSATTATDLRTSRIVWIPIKPTTSKTRHVMKAVRLRLRNARVQSRSASLSSVRWPVRASATDHATPTTANNPKTRALTTALPPSPPTERLAQ